MNPPRLSIVTVCLDNAAFVAEAIESVAGQAVSALEHIVVDGGSTDGTLDILARYPNLRVVSGPDGGVYDAMNRGIGMARGDIVGLVHSDDLLLPGALTTILERFDAGDEPEVVSCGTSVFCTPGDESVTLLPGGQALSPDSVAFGVPCLNARFFKRALFERIGGFRKEFQPTADREFLLRLITSRPRRVALEKIVYAYRLHDRSGTLNRSPDTAAWLWEKHVELTTALLAESRWPPGIRRTLRDWRSIENLKLLLAAARRLKTGAVGSVLGQTVRHDRLWAMRMPRAAVAWRRWRGRHSGF